MRLSFRNVCDETSEIAKETGDFRAWLFLILVSGEVRVSLFDETVPDLFAQERLGERSSLAASVVAEFTGFARREDADPNLVGSVVEVLNRVNEIKRRIDLDPKLAAEADEALHGAYLRLCDFYRIVTGLSAQEDQGGEA